MIRESLIRVKQDFKSKDEVIRAIVLAADADGLLPSAGDFAEAVYHRGEEISTSIGYGIAIPHGKTDAVKEAFIAFVSLQEPIRWDEGGTDDVEAVFLIGVPQTNTEMLHLKAIAAISKRLMREEFRKQLYACTDNHAAFQMLDDIDKSIADG